MTLGCGLAAFGGVLYYTLQNHSKSVYLSHYGNVFTDKQSFYNYQNEIMYLSH